MRILFCTKYDLIGNMMLNLMLPKVAADHQVTVILANRRRPETESIPELKWLSLFEQELPARLLFPLLDAKASVPVQSDRGASWETFDQLAGRYSIPIRNAGHIEHHSLLTDLVRDSDPDLIVSFQFGFIFKPEALQLARIGGLNLHSGALPQRAGVNPTFWCMKDRDPEAACSLHWLTPQIDSGDIVDVRSVQIDYGHSFFWNWIANYRNGSDMICDAIQTLGSGRTLTASKQDPAQIRFVPKPSPDDLKSFASSGLRLIDPADCLDIIGRYLPVATQS